MKILANLSCSIPTVLAANAIFWNCLALTPDRIDRFLISLASSAALSAIATSAAAEPRAAVANKAVCLAASTTLPLNACTFWPAVLNPFFSGSISAPTRTAISLFLPRSVSLNLTQMATQNQVAILMSLFQMSNQS